MSALAWAVVVAGLSLAVGALWSRPSVAERAALARGSAPGRLRLYLPLSSGWLRHARPGDYETLAALRRRMRVSLVAAVCLPLLLWFALRQAPEVADVAPASPQHAVVRQPSPAAPTPAAAAKRKTVQTPADAERLEPEEPLEELRTQQRLYGTAKVKPVYELHDVKGVRIENVAPGSFWDLVGLRSGDVVVELHGSPIDSPAAAIALMNALERDDTLTLRARGQDGIERYIEYTAPR